MSFPDKPPQGWQNPNDQSLRGCGSVLLILAGIILLLPGACALFFAVGFYPDWNDQVFLLWIVCLAVSGGGIALIWIAVRRLRTAGDRIMAGIVLLLPGACALAFIVYFNVTNDSDALRVLLPVWLVCLAVSLGGIIVIGSGLQRRRKPPRDGP